MGEAALIRGALLVQLTLVYPLLCHIIRSQLFDLMCWDTVPSYLSLTANAFICLIGIWFAEYYPNVGSVISWTGAICGLFLIFVLPSTCFLKHMQERGTSTRFKRGLLYGVMGVGVANVIMQFCNFLK